MSAEINEPDMSMWFSTYGMLTVERLLEGFHLNLSHEEVVTAIKNPHSLYYQLLRIPLKNVFNGIILQQTQDYQVYAQKLFIDFLLSGQNDKEEGSPGSNTREDLETERTRLIELGEEFSKQELLHQKLIANSQASLIQISRDLQQSIVTASKKIKAQLQRSKINKSEDVVQHSIKTGMIFDDKVDDSSALFWIKIAEILEIKLTPEQRLQTAESLTKLAEHRAAINKTLGIYLEQTEDMSINLRSYRSQFYQTILKVTELIKLLPDYHPDVIREAENRSTLNFDAKIGE